MPSILRQIVTFSIFVLAVMAIVAPLGCGARTDMLAAHDDDVPVGTPGTGGTYSQTSSNGGSGGLLDFGGSSGSGGYVYAAGGSGGYVYAVGGSGGYVYAVGGSGGYIYAAGGSGGYAVGGAGGSSVSSAPGPYAVEAGGYVKSGPWQGYAWTVTDPLGSTISPSDFSMVGAGGRLCVKGVVVADPSYDVYAILGINVAQPQNGGSPGVWTPTGWGLAYSLTTDIASPLRVQIQGAAGYPSESWCADVTGSSGKIPWTQFSQNCWWNSGPYYDGKTPLQSVMFEVPGTNSNSVSYSFCVNSIGPI
jgi:hypothetical protein